tara:strand:- start:187 stop:504 length:318 start_codon:yes stop_codon:yes gene_type:complete
MIDPFTELLIDAGFELVETGGGCTALMRVLRYSRAREKGNSDIWIMITDGQAGTDFSHEEIQGDMFIGIYEGHPMHDKVLFTINGKIDHFDKTMAVLTDEWQTNG